MHIVSQFKSQPSTDDYDKPNNRPAVRMSQSSNNYAHLNVFVHWNWTAAGSDHVAREGRKGEEEDREGERGDQLIARCPFIRVQ